MLSVKEDLFVCTTFVGTVAILFVWKRKFLIDFLIRREEHQARKNNPRQSKIGTRHSTSKEVLANILSSNNNNKNKNNSKLTISEDGRKIELVGDSSSSSNSNSNSYQAFASTLARGGKNVVPSLGEKNHDPDFIPSASASLTNSHSTTSSPLTVGANDGSAFGIVDRIPRLFPSLISASLNANPSGTNFQGNDFNNNKSKNNENVPFSKYDQILPGSSALLLMKGFDVSETFAPSVPHRNTVPRGGPLGALLYPIFCQDSSSNLKNIPNNNTSKIHPDFALVVDGGDFGSIPTDFEGSNNKNNKYRDEHYSSTLMVNTSINKNSNWVEALLLASANMTSRGGERCSGDIELAIESLLTAKRRRQAIDAFSKDKDVPLKSEIYDQLLRTFLNDRDHIFTILTAMEMHGIFQAVLKSGERTSLAQSIFEALSLHDHERAVSAFNIHHGNYLKKQQHNISSNNNFSLATTTIPVYSGLLAGLIQRGMKQEAKTIILALKNSDASKDIAPGLIRCLHNEFEFNLAKQQKNKTNQNSTVPPSKRIVDALEFTQDWLALLPQEVAEGQSEMDQQNNNILGDSLQKSKIGLHARVACSVFAEYPNPFTCSALSRFLLQHFPHGSTPVLQRAISVSLFPPIVNNNSNSNNNNQRNKLSSHQNTMMFATAALSSSSFSSSPPPTTTTTALHLARLSISRGIARRGNWQLAMSMAQQCLKAKTFEPVGPLAATVAQSGKWNAALRLGTQLFALRRAPPTAHELSLCVHSSLWSGKWSSALFWVERAHSRGLKFESSVYDAAFAAASAAAAVAGGGGGGGANSSLLEENSNQNNFMNMTNNSFANPSSHRHQRQHPNFEAAIRTVQCMAEMGGQCSGESIEKLIATASKIDPSNNKMSILQSSNGASDNQEGAPKIIEVLCDSGIVDWKL